MLSLGLRGKAFRLDSSHPNLGTACLVYAEPRVNVKEGDAKEPDGSGAQVASSRQRPPQLKDSSTEPNAQIWFLDPSFHWHFLAPTFSHYYRMMLFHLGLPEWEYRFTTFGISSWAEVVNELKYRHDIGTVKTT